MRDFIKHKAKQRKELPIEIIKLKAQMKTNKKQE